jgi:hypothetical protein
MLLHELNRWLGCYISYESYRGVPMGEGDGGDGCDGDGGPPAQINFVILSKLRRNGGGGVTSQCFHL